MIKACTIRLWLAISVDSRWVFSMLVWKYLIWVAWSFFEPVQYLCTMTNFEHFNQLDEFYHWAECSLGLWTRFGLRVRCSKLITFLRESHVTKYYQLSVPEWLHRSSNYYHFRRSIDFLHFSSIYHWHSIEFTL